jgi:transposase
MVGMLLQVLYSVRSERQLVEQIQYNLLFRWFVGLAIEDEVRQHRRLGKFCPKRLLRWMWLPLRPRTASNAAQRYL